jgi:hypothetical protein
MSGVKSLIIFLNDEPELSWPVISEIVGIDSPTIGNDFVMNTIDTNEFHDEIIEYSC